MWEIINGIICSLTIIAILFIFGRLVIGKRKIENKINTLILILIATGINTLIYLYTIGSTKTILTCILYILTFKEIFKIEQLPEGVE